MAPFFLFSFLSLDLHMNTNLLLLLKSTFVFLSTVLFIKLLLKIWSKPRKTGTLPPTAKTFSILIRGIIAAIKGEEATFLREQYERLGSVFALNFWPRKVTFLIEPDVVEQFFRASDEMLGQREVYKFLLPILGPGIGFDANPVDKRHQIGFLLGALRTSKLSSYVNLMVAEVEEYVSKWKDCGTIDLQNELNHLVMMVGSRCLLGEHARDSMVENFVSLFVQVECGVTPLGHIFPYIPSPAHIRCDRARAKISTILSNIMNERIKFGTSNDDLLQSFIDNYKGENQTSKDQIIGLIMAALFGSHHTTSVSSFWNGVYKILSKRMCVCSLY